MSVRESLRARCPPAYSRGQRRARVAESSNCRSRLAQPLQTLALVWPQTLMHLRLLSLTFAHSHRIGNCSNFSRESSRVFCRLARTVCPGQTRARVQISLTLVWPQTLMLSRRLSYSLSDPRALLATFECPCRV